MEVIRSVECLRYYAAQEVSPVVRRDTPTDRIGEQRYPLGLVAVITPWNYLVLLMLLRLAPALVARNTVIAKPAPTTPLSTLLVGEVAARYLPGGVFQIIVDDNDLGSILASHPGIAHGR